MFYERYAVYPYIIDLCTKLDGLGFLASDDGTYIMTVKADDAVTDFPPFKHFLFLYKHLSDDGKTLMKLLWESLEWLYRHICRHCRELGIRRPRNKYRNVAESYLSYCKKRKRRASRTRMLKRRMIKLLEKLLSQRDGIHSEYGALLRYTQDYHKRLSIIRKVLVQEKEMFEGRKVSDRIVSIDRHYVRPIVRGKENKSVEFGAKAVSYTHLVPPTEYRIKHIDLTFFSESVERNK